MNWLRNKAWSTKKNETSTRNSSSADSQTKLRDIFETQYGIVNQLSSSFDTIIQLNQSVLKNSNAIESIKSDFENAMKIQSQVVSQIAAQANSIDQLQLKLASNEKLARQVIDEISKIDDISYQSKILALNASIEAARAGDSGKSFAVVAESVKNLADNSAEISQQIKSNITQFQCSIDELSTEFKGVSLQLNESLANIQKSGEIVNDKSILMYCILDEIADSSSRTGDSAKESQGKFKSELEALTKLTSDLIGSITGTQILDLEPKNVITKDFILIDVRKTEEYNDELGHIANANLYTLGPALDRFLDTADPSQKYLFICRSGGRSARGARIAQTKGFKNIFNLKGGMIEWNKCHLPIGKS